eukprot:snap_masked-scaffold_33-processed-gene-3.29-mRNA-1 protein AED:1.00 eAED:1.00 QI:0/-1/0/0/-1/1/1/0/183
MLDEVVNYHDALVQKYVNGTIQKLRSLLTSEAKLSSETGNFLKNESREMYCTYIRMYKSDVEFEVKDENQERNFIVQLIQKKGSKFLSCACSMWINIHFPCRYFAMICVRLGLDFFYPKHLLSRWKYHNHPSYKRALTILGRLPTIKPMTMEFRVQVPDLKNFKAPVKTSSKYSKMLAEAKLL